MNAELQIAIDAATQAAAAIRQIWDQENAWVVDKEGGKGPLTQADLAADAIIQDCLKTAFPSDAILSEETTDDPSRLGRSRVWIIDPVDGTREFVERVPEFVVSVGLVIDGVAMLGVLLNPITGELMTGVVGQGATYNGSPASVTDRRSLAGARVVVSRSETQKGWFDHWASDVNLEPVGSVAYKLGLVGTGQADATFTPKPRSEWDVCAGAAIIAAAGGRATDGSDIPYRFNRTPPLHQGVVGTNGHLHAAIMALIDKA
ncbi:MAG: 3'(2'),5'-bisphosphate nucleotidase CysQ [Myxococcota bacterium]